MSATCPVVGPDHRNDDGIGAEVRLPGTLIGAKQEERNRSIAVRSKAGSGA